MAKITKTELRKKLQTCSAEELVRELCDLAGMYPQVNAYFYAKYGGEDAAKDLLAHAKAAIEKEFFPSRGIPRASVSAAKKVISEFKKHCSDPVLIAQLQLFYVYTVSDFADSYGADEHLCNTMYSQAEAFAKTIAKLEPAALKPCLPMIDKIEEISYHIGYGMDGFLSEILCNYGLFPDEIEAE